jgi:DNA-directed RNA polymerase subunit RPC12/RpoP
MSQIKFQCSHCQQRLECDEEFGGSEIPCPACNELTLVPPAPAKPAPSPQKSGMTYVPESWRKPTPPPPQAGAK